MPPTRRGIYHNLKESEYTVSNSEIVFFFSSKVYQEKFLREYRENRKCFRHRLNKQGKDIPINLDIIADITLYQTIEKRGFRACVGGVDTSCENLYQYALRLVTKKNTLDWYEIQKPKLHERKRSMGLT